MRRWPRILALAFVLATWAVVTWGYWSQSGAGSASATTASLDAASISVPGSAINAVTVTWTAQSSLNPSSAANSAITYSVERRLGSGSWAAIASGGCSGSKSRGTTSCVDAPAAAGSYTYRAVAAYHSWTASSNVAGPVTFTIDTTPPTVSSIVRADADPTNASSLHWTVTFSESVTGVGSADFTLPTTGSVSGATISSVTGSGASYTVTVATGSGTGALGLNLVDDDSIVDTATNKLGGTGAGNGNLTGQTYALDLTPPSVSTIARAASSPTNASSLQWTVTFSESVTGVGSTDFTLAATGLSGAAISSVTGSGASYTVTVATGTGDGTLGLNLVDDDTIVDTITNKLGGTGTGNGNLTGETYAVDKTVPSVTSMVRADSSPTNASTVHWTVTFGEPVTGVGTGDFALASSGIGGATISSVTGSGATYTVTVATGSGVGTLGLNLVDDDTITDAAGNKVGGAGANNGDLTGPTYTLDLTPPTVSSIVRAASSPTNATSVTWTVTFSESVTGVDTGDLALATTGTISGATISTVTGSGTAYTVTVATGTGDGTLGLNLVDDDTVIDTLTNKLGGTGTGNGNLTGQTYTVDKTAPTLTSMDMLDTNTNGKIDRVTATFSEPLNTSTLTSQWTLSGSVPSAATLASVSTSAAVATLVLTEGAGTADTAVGTFKLALASNASGIRDAAGNQASFAATAPTDRAGPVPISISDGEGQIIILRVDGQLQGGDSLTATFSEAIASGLPGSTPITEAAPAGGGNSLLTITGFTDGALDMGSANYATLGITVPFSGSSALTNAGKTITITAGTCGGLCLNLLAGSGTTMVYKPAPTLLDAAGNAAAGSILTGFRIF